MKTIKNVMLGIVIGVMLTRTVVVATSGNLRTLTAEFCGISIDIDQRQFIPKDATGKKVEPFIVDGTTYLPVRAIAEAFNKEVIWNEEAKEIQIFTKSEPITDEEVEKAFEENYLKSNTISQVIMADGTKTPPNSKTLEEYKINSVEGVGINLWAVKFDVKPKHNPDADIDSSKSPYMYGWVAGNGVIDGDWVRGKSLSVYVVKTDGVIKLSILGTGL